VGGKARALVIRAAAAIIALGIGAFYVFKRPAALITSNSKNTERGSVSAGFEPTAIKLWDTPEEVAKGNGVSLENQALHLESGGSVNYTKRTSRDAIIRAEIRMNPDADANLALRWRLQAGDEDFYRVGTSAKGTIELQSVHHGGKPYDRLGSWPLPRSYGVDEWLRIELRAIGDDLTVSVDGAVIGTVHDATQPEAGGVMVYAKGNSYFRNIVFVPLDKTFAPDTEVIRLWNSPEEIPKISGVKWEDNAMRLDGVMMENHAPVCSNAEIRAMVKMNPDARAAHIDLRGRSLHGKNGEKQDVAYTLGLEPIRKVIQLLAFTPDWTLLREWPYPRAFAANEWAQLELRTVGNELTVSFDGKHLGTIHDSAITQPGTVRVYGKEKTYFRDIVFTPLNGTATTRVVASQSAKPASDVIRLWNAPEKIKKAEGISWEDGALRLDNAMEVTMPPYHADAMIHASIKMNPDAVSPSINLRGFDENGADGRYSATVLAADKKVQLQVFDSRPSSANRRTVLQEWPLPRAYASDEWARLELRVQGDALTVALDGQVLGTIHNNALTNPGSAQVYATRAGFFRDIALVPLEHQGTTPLVTSDPLPAISNWQDMTDAVRERARAFPNLVVEPGLVRHLGSGSQVSIPLTRPGIRDYAVRLRFVSDGQITLRTRVDGSLYVLCQRNQTIFHHYEIAAGAPTLLRPNVPHPSNYDASQPHDLLVTMQGSMLRAWLDDRFIGEAHDAKFQDGDAKLVFTNSTTVHKVEVAELAADH
jgi:hypothetical protein